MFETFSSARHAGDSSNHEDDGQNRKDEDVEHDWSPYRGFHGHAEKRQTHRRDWSPARVPTHGHNRGLVPYTADVDPQARWTGNGWCATLEVVPRDGSRITRRDGRIVRIRTCEMTT